MTPETKIVAVQTDCAAKEYNVKIGADLLAECGEWARECLPSLTKRVVVVSNRRVFRLYGEQVAASLTAVGFQTAVWLMRDGEQYKNLRSLESALAFFAESRLTRADAVVALGGGVVGDLAGFAAAVYLRGIAFLQIPTTLLAQIDSSVGGKTAVNTVYGKNLVGAWHQPCGVLVDIATLKTLPRRELTAGFCEAIKQGAAGDRSLFDRTADFLTHHPPSKLSGKRQAFDDADDKLQGLIAAQIQFKTDIVTGDAGEDMRREDNRSRRILNFGHTVGHALEKATDYKRFRHGEAVGYGLLVAAEISKRLDKVSQQELKLLYDVLRRVGGLPVVADVNVERVVAAFAHDKKSTGDSFKWVLLNSLGRAEIVDNREIPAQIVDDSIRRVWQFDDRSSGRF